MEFVPTKP